MCVGHEIRREILRRKESEGNGSKDRVIGSIWHECKGGNWVKEENLWSGGEKKGSVRTEYVERCVKIHDSDYYLWGADNYFVC